MWGGELSIIDDREIRLDVKLLHLDRRCIALGGSTATAALTLLAIWPWLSAGYLVFCGGFGWIVWWDIFTVILAKMNHFRIDPKTMRACYIPSQQVICLELENGRWRGIKALRREHDKLLATLRKVYGDRMYEE